MITMRCVSQPQFAEGFVVEAVGDLWEPWMRAADRILDDEQLLNSVYEALVRRHPYSRTRGRLGVPAEIVMRMLLLKHIRNWSFDVLEREVRLNLLYREFTRVAAGKVPDSKTLGRHALALGPEVIKQIHERVVALAMENKVVQGRKMRLDTTVVEANIHYPTDSSLLGDGGADTCHEEDRRDCRQGRGQTARPQSQREVPNTGDWSNCAHSGRTEPGAITAGLPEAFEQCESGSGTGQEVFRGDCRRCQTSSGRHAASRPGIPPETIRHHCGAGTAGDAANKTEDLRRRYTCPRKAG